MSGDKTGSRSNSRQGSRQDQPSQSETTGGGGERVVRGQNSWMLDHVAEIVHLATQIQLTQQVSQALADFDGGNKDTIQVREMRQLGNHPCKNDWHFSSTILSQFSCNSHAIILIDKIFWNVPRILTCNSYPIHTRQFSWNYHLTTLSQFSSTILK